MADQLDAAADELVPIGVRETHLGEPRLRGELRRTTFQLRLFADVVDDGAYLDIRIDHADPDWPMGAPRPDLRRILHPLGPVLVFAASNFPFAFSVAGGDTASALAAGCPVVVKAHPGHPELSAATAAVVQRALADAGAPDGVFGLIFGTDAGVAALRAPQIKAASFTGSIAGGRALFDIASQRPEPIPFYGELGSVNPVFVTRERRRADPTKSSRSSSRRSRWAPGSSAPNRGCCWCPATARSSSGSRRRSCRDRPLCSIPGSRRGTSRACGGWLPSLRCRCSRSGDPYADPPSPTLLTTAAADLLADLREGRDEVFRECFGPTTLVASYDNDDELLAVAEAIDGQLTASIIGTDDDPVVAPLRDALALKAGRVLWNGWPTGVSVTYAQQHGGPYPATTAPTTTSVGTDAIARFLRPVAYQGFPPHLLPAALRDDTELPRLVDGRRDHGGRPPAPRRTDTRARRRKDATRAAQRG